jgi:hypothetical protein
MKLGFSQQIFEKSSNTKFHQNPSTGSRVVQCGRTDMTKLIAVFHNSANAPKKDSYLKNNVAYKPHISTRWFKYDRDDL